MNRHAVIPVVAAAMAATLLVAGCGARGGADAGHESRMPVTARAATAYPATAGPSSGAAAESPGSSGSPHGVASGACGAPAAQPSGAGDELGGVQFVSGSTGWAVGLDRILGTDDGGQHWMAQYRTSASARLNSVDFADARHGWVVGASTILATADGGGHWHPLPEPCPVLRTVHFVSPVVGFAVAGGDQPVSGAPVSGGVLMKTTDGGRNWRRLPAPADVQTACFADLRSGSLGAGGLLYRTADGGQTWVPAGRGARAQSNAPTLAEVECAGPGAAWAELTGPGAAMSQGPHIGYHAAGVAWKPIFAEQYFPHPGVFVSASSPGSYPGPFSAVSPADAVFIDYCPACGAGTAPMDLARDGGARLEPVGNVGGLTQASAAAFVTLDDGWVAGTQTTYRASSATATVVNRIVHTSDGGRTWQVQYAIGP